MDYAYGISSRSDPVFDTYVAFYRARTNTTVLTTLSAVGMPALEGLSRHLNDLPGASKPIGDLFICSHGNESGWLEVRLLSILPVGHVEFDTLLQYHSRLALDSSTITAASSSQAGSFVRFRACRIGQAEPFMRLLKEAYGGQARVTASKHFFNYGAGNINGHDIAYEFLSYGFMIKRRDVQDQRIRNRQEAVDAFRTSGFSFYEGTAVPNARWGQWMPPGAPNDHAQKVIRLRMAAGEQLLGFDTEFRQERISAPDGIPYQGGPLNQADAKTRALTYLATLPSYQPDHPGGRPASVPPYPVYAQHGFSTLDEFVAAFQWTRGSVGGHSALLGSRLEYLLIVPIFDPATSLVLNNLLPSDGVGPPIARNGLDENNPALFWNG